MQTTPAPRPDDDQLRVPFWIVLAGVGVGAFWALAGVLVGARLRSRGHDRHHPHGHDGHRHDRHGHDRHCRGR